MPGTFKPSVLPNRSSVPLSPISTTANQHSKDQTRMVASTLPGLPRTAAKPTLLSSTASSISATTKPRSKNASPSAEANPTALSKSARSSPSIQPPSPPATSQPTASRRSQISPA